MAAERALKKGVGIGLEEEEEVLEVSLREVWDVWGDVWGDVWDVWEVCEVLLGAGVDATGEGAARSEVGAGVDFLVVEVLGGRGLRTSGVPCGNDLVDC